MIHQKLGSRKAAKPTHEGYTPETARIAFLDWMRVNKMSQAKVIKMLESKGITISADYMSKIVRGERGPGNAFIQVFHECTGIHLAPGLVVTEKEK